MSGTRAQLREKKSPIAYLVDLYSRQPVTIKAAIIGGAFTCITAVITGLCAASVDAISWVIAHRDLTPPVTTPAEETRSILVQIAYIEIDPAGDDVAGEFVRIENTGEEPIDMTGWTLCDEAGATFIFPPFTLTAGSYVNVWVKAGINTATDLYWGRGSAVWNNTGDCAYLRDREGVLVDSYSY